MNNPEESFPKSRIHTFLNDLAKLCEAHKVCIYTRIEPDKQPTTVVDFTDWELFEELEVDNSGASVYWPRIESHIARNR